MPPLAWIRSSYRREVCAELQEDLTSCARESPLQHHELGAADPEHAEERDARELRIGFSNETRLVDEVEDGEQQNSDDEPEQIQQDQDAPTQVARRGRRLAATGLVAVNLESVDGGHVAAFYPMTIGGLASRKRRHSLFGQCWLSRSTEPSRELCSATASSNRSSGSSATSLSRSRCCSHSRTAFSARPEATSPSRPAITT